MRSRFPHRRNIPTPTPSRAELCARCRKRETCAFADVNGSPGREAGTTSHPHVITRIYRAGENIVQQGEPRGTLLVVCRGLTLVTTLLETGEEVALKVSGVGKALGLADWLKDEATYAVTATALSDTTIVFLDPTELRRRLQDGSHLDTLFNQIGSHLSILEHRLSSLQAYDAFNRIVQFFLDVVLELGLEGEENVVLPLRPSRSVLAKLAGLTPETTSRILGDLQRRRLIRRSDERFVIPSLARLRQALAQSGKKTRGR